MLDLGSIGRFLAALGGLWDRSEQYLSLMMGIAFPLAALVFTLSMLQAFLQEDTEETGFRMLSEPGPESGSVIHHPFQGVIRHFLDCINTGTEPDTAVRRMRPGVAAILAAQTSMALGVPVTPEP